MNFNPVSLMCGAKRCLLKCTVKTRCEVCIGLHEINKCPRVERVCLRARLLSPVPEELVRAAVRRSSSVSELLLLSPCAPVTGPCDHILQANRREWTNGVRGRRVLRAPRSADTSTQKGSGAAAWASKAGSQVAAGDSEGMLTDTAVPTGWVIFLQPASCEKYSSEKLFNSAQFI